MVCAQPLACIALLDPGTDGQLVAGGRLLGREIFEQARLPITESDLLVVQLPDGKQPLLQICKALLSAELNVHYAYPILVGPQGCSALALHVEDHENAAQTLLRNGFVLFTENDFNS